MGTTKDERRTAARIPANTLQQIASEAEGAIGVNVIPAEGAYDQTASLRDIHQNGMSFFLSDHILAEDDIIHIDTMLGDFSFESDAIVRWTMGSYVGVEFLDSRARNAALLAELYTEKLLRYMQSQEN
jgi:hypothetical protein